MGLTSLLTNVGLNGVRALPVTVRHHLVFGCPGHGQSITAVGAKAVKVEPMVIGTASDEHGLELVRQRDMVEREQAF